MSTTLNNTYAVIYSNDFLLIISICSFDFFIRASKESAVTMDSLELRALKEETVLQEWRVR